MQAIKYTEFFTPQLYYITEFCICQQISFRFLYFVQINKKGRLFMCKMYEIVSKLCKEKGISVGKLCREVGISTSSLSELKAGRTKRLSTQNTSKIATYFNVSVEYLIGETNEKSSTLQVSDDDIKFALFGGEQEVTDEMYDEVKEYVKFIKSKYKKD